MLRRCLSAVWLLVRLSRAAEREERVEHDAMWPPGETGGRGSLQGAPRQAAPSDEHDRSHGRAGRRGAGEGRGEGRGAGVRRKVTNERREGGDGCIKAGAQGGRSATSKLRSPGRVRAARAPGGLRQSTSSPSLPPPFPCDSSLRPPSLVNQGVVASLGCGAPASSACRFPRVWACAPPAGGPRAAVLLMLARGARDACCPSSRGRAPPRHLLACLSLLMPT